MTMQTDRLSQRAEGRKVNLSPYLIGVALGALSWVAFAVAKEPIGVTTALSRVGQPVAALIFGATAAAHNPYWAPMPFSWDYSMLFLVGLMAGALVSSLASGTFRIEAVPNFWRARFGCSVTKRFVAAFLAGALLMFGARMAGGCTSGHGLSGTLQLALSSWIFVVVVFAAAIMGSRIIFGRKATP